MVDTGLDKQQIEDLKRWFSALCADPVRLRLYVCLVLLAVGYLGVVRPLGMRLVKAHSDLKKMKGAARRASNSAHYVGQRDFYEPKLTNRSDIVYWQSYVMRKLDAAGVTLNSLDPGEDTAKFAFKIVRMQLSARAEHYQDIVDFVDRIEHGEHVVRLESMQIDETTDALILTCSVLALVKPGLKLPQATGPPTAAVEEAADETPPQEVAADEATLEADAAVAAEAADLGTGPEAPAGDEAPTAEAAGGGSDG